jgi:hypothetical protein
MGVKVCEVQHVASDVNLAPSYSYEVSRTSGFRVYSCALVDQPYALASERY